MNVVENGEITNLYQGYIHRSRYSRWKYDLGRRETWEETVDRYVSFFHQRYPDALNKHYDGQPLHLVLKQAIMNMEVMPSMRCMMTAGEALARDNVAGYNCSYETISGKGAPLYILTEEMLEAGFDEPITIHANHPKAFDEIMYILLCGTGVGFSVERQYISTLPVIGHKLPRTIYGRNNKSFPGVKKDDLSYFDRKSNTIHVADSKYGWASGLRILIVELYNGNFNVKWDLSKIREAGSPLKTFGGRASGPAPLNKLFTYCVDVFKNANGRKLTSIEAHGLVCQIADVVVVGGVRRSALISLSNLSDDRLRHAKSGDWWTLHPEYALANNSAVYTEKPNAETFLREYTALIESKSGERGIVNRQALCNQASRNGRRNASYDFGTNPCSEIILRPSQFCNLSEIVVRSGDTFESLTRKVKLATILGTLQATLTDFVYLNPEWKKNTEEEALLGVSLTGIMDHRILSNSNNHASSWEEFCGSSDKYLRDVLQELKEVAVETNKEWADKLGINQSTAITCIKPSGTVSQLVDSASGIHPRYSNYYIRTVRADKKDPLARMMVEMGFPHEDDVFKPDTNYVFSFPVKAPENSVFRDDRSAIQQLELWLTYQRHWCEHKPSITVYYREDEIMELGAWVWEHFDELAGVSFLPHTEHTYQQAPYQEISEAEYNEWVERMPKDIDWNMLSKFEQSDLTIASQELACAAGVCEVV